MSALFANDVHKTSPPPILLRSEKTFVISQHSNILANQYLAEKIPQQPSTFSFSFLFFLKGIGAKIFQTTSAPKTKKGAKTCCQTKKVETLQLFPESPCALHCSEFEVVTRRKRTQARFSANVRQVFLAYYCRFSLTCWKRPRRCY